MRQAKRLLLLGIAVGGTGMAQVPTPVAPTVPAPAAAPVPAEPAPEEDEEGEAIVVTGQRPPGSVIGDVPPEVQIGPAEIRSYGVSTVTELLNELSPQTGSARGRGGEAPVVLLNGKRIASFAEIRSIPTEAILRVDILPEEVALKYGYRADQKVVNFVLRPRFSAVTAEADASTSTDGGGSGGEGELNLFRIQGDGRLNVEMEYNRSARLLESQRDILPSPARRPFDAAGNVTSTVPGGEIDPALSALAGGTVTIAGVPAGLASTAPTLAQFAGTAGTANVTDVGRFRTLRPATDALSLNATLARTLLGVSATLNGSVSATGSTALRGLPGATLTVPAANPFSPFGPAVSLFRYPEGAGALAQTNAAETAHAGLTVNGNVATWQWTLTANYDRNDSRTRTETGVDFAPLQAGIDGGLNPFGPVPAELIGATLADQARAIASTGNVQLVANGTLLAVPAGNVSTTVRVGGESSGFDTRSVRSGVIRTADLSRRNGNAQGSIDVPLTSRRAGFLDAIGDLSANGNVSVDRLSDFGTLTTYGYGLTWKPRTNLSLIWSTTEDEGAPTVQQLGNPQISTLDVRVFDYLRGQTASVTRIDGGNPALLADDRRVTKLGLTYRPLPNADLSLTANYVRSRIRNGISGLPAPTAQIEAAFPDRFMRDADGNLIGIDSRPLNFARQDRSQLRWGFNFSKPLQSSQALVDAYRALRQSRGGGEGLRPGGQGARGEGAGRPGGGFGGRGRGGGGGGARGGGRMQFGVYHTWLFRNEVLIRDGLPVLDLLGGASTGSSGGQPRHRIEAQAGVTNNGIGARLSVNYQSGTDVLGGTASELGDLRFSDLTTANLRLFADLGQVPALVSRPWARGMRVTLAVTNLTNQRIDVRDAAGATPLGYQPGYLDAIGREVRVSVRKLFR